MKGLKLRRILLVIVIFCIGILMQNKSYGALQANTRTQYTKQATSGEWMSWFRQMEQAGQSMGLSETLNSDLTPKESNGIDVHMMRSTEYGAIAILSMSGYGNSSNAKVLTTTTGNNTGVIMNTNVNILEYVAGSLGNQFSANDRYYDNYTASTASAKIGDALGTCAGWHSASYRSWVSSQRQFFRRGEGGIFSFYAGGINDWAYARGVAVCGEGL